MNAKMKPELLKKLAREYYGRKDIQGILVREAKNREVVPRYIDAFGKRPDTLQYENDVSSLADKGATSFHYSEEIWKNPFDLAVGLSQQEMNKLRTGWDLIIDIDCPYLDYSRIATELIIEALRFYNIDNMGVKYSGNKGFHIGIAFDAFPEEVNGINIKDYFPEGPRIMVSYLKSLIWDKLKERIANLTRDNSLKNIKVVDEEGAKKVIPDLVLVSSRHLLRMPYSLHERTGLMSIVIKPEQLKDFHPGWAKPSMVVPKPFLPKPEKNEAKELLIQALDWDARQKKRTIMAKTEVKGKEKTFKQIDPLVLKGISSDFYPPCILAILKGMKDDGRKRALFILINFFRSLSLDKEEIKKKIDEWNKLNYVPLREGYIKAQLSWFDRQKNMLPPNCDKTYYKDIAVCMPDFFCGKIKNPVNYVLKKIRLKEQYARTEEEPARKKRRRKCIRNESILNSE